MLRVCLMFESIAMNHIHSTCSQGHCLHDLIFWQYFLFLARLGVIIKEQNKQIKQARKKDL